MATTPAIIVIGNDVPLAVQIKRNKATFVIDPGATVKGIITSLDHNYTYTAEFTASNAAVGADWATSLVVFDLTSAQTAVITYTGIALVEIQVNDGGKSTFFADVEIIKGTIA